MSIRPEPIEGQYLSDGKNITSHNSSGGSCSAPSLIEPGDEATLSSRTITFRWNAVSGCTFNGYTFRIKNTSDMDSGGTTLIDTGEGGMQRTETINGWDNQDLCWGVKATNAPNGASWAVRRFRINPQSSTGTWRARYDQGVTCWWDTNCSMNPRCEQDLGGSELHKDWGSSAPCGGMNGDDWVADIRGTINFPSGSYVFRLENDDGAKVWLNGQNIQERGGSGNGPICNGTGGYALNGDQSLRVLLREEGGDAKVHLTWTTDTSLCQPPIPATPTLSSPGNGSSNPYNHDLTFQWNGVSSATEYLVEWWGGPYGTMQPCGWSNSTSCHIGQVAADSTYSWRVRARNGSGESGWSDQWSFTIQAQPPTCYALTRTHSGSGSDPVASPANSTGCPSSQYVAGASISLSASPANGWRVGSWNSTDEDSSMSTTNSLTMSASNRTVGVNYVEIPPGDTTPPTGRIISPPDNSTVTACPLPIVADATDPGSGVAWVRFWAAYDGAWHDIVTDTSGADGWTASWDCSQVSDQQVTLTTWMEDRAGNQIRDPGGYTYVTLDRTPPALCYTLSRTHTGSGSDPVASPANSTGCPTGRYVSGASINLTASPASGWQVGSWIGTDNNNSTSPANSLTMPAGNRTVSVAYIAVPPPVACTGPRLFFDDFSSPATGWSTDDTAEIWGGYYAGEYRILHKATGRTVWDYPPPSFINYILSADVRLAGNVAGSHGLIFGLDHSQNQNYYAFDIKNGQYRLRAREGSNWYELRTWTASEYIKTGTDVNRLEVHRKDQQIDLYANGHYLATFVDGRFPGSRGVGVFSTTASGDSTNVDVRFDNFAVLGCDSSAPNPLKKIYLPLVLSQYAGVPAVTPTRTPTQTPAPAPTSTSAPTRTPAPTSTVTRTPMPTSIPTQTPASTATPYAAWELLGFQGKGVLSIAFSPNYANDTASSRKSTMAP